MNDEPDDVSTAGLYYEGIPSICRVCGCTYEDRARCIARTGRPCHWAAPGLCSACAPRPMRLATLDPSGMGALYAVGFAILELQSCQAVPYVEPPAVLYTFGWNSAWPKPSCVLTWGRGARWLHFDYYAEKMGGHIGSPVAQRDIVILCAGFHAFLALSGRDGGGAPREPDQMLWRRDWYAPLRDAIYA